MSEKLTPETRKIMTERFGRDSLIALATLDNDKPAVRTVDGYYENGAFYTITHALSNKMQQISKNPVVAVCGEWFTAHGIADNIGHVCSEENRELADKLRAAFAAWYSNGHTDESDPNTCILRVRLTDGVLMSEGKRYEIDFT